MTLQEAMNIAAKLECWEGPVTVEALEGGITNHNILVHAGTQRYVVRLGKDIPEHGIMRWHELAASHAAHSAGVSPKVHFHQEGVLVLDFIESKALEESDLHKPEVLVSVVELLKKTHTQIPLHMRGNVLSFWVFQILRDYTATLRDHKSSYVPKLDSLLDQARLLEKAVGSVELVFGHNDMLPANILDDGNRYWLIDWEYGGFNSPLFDLGGLASNCALERDAEAVMLQTYYQSPPDDALWNRYDAMKCASLLRETMWSMVSEITSELDFDYTEYTLKNLERYQDASAEFFQKGRKK